MTFHIEKQLTKVKVIVLGLILGVGISVAFAWQDPTDSFPNGNVPAPVNVGSTEQTKGGRLNINDSFWANFLGVDGSAYVDGRLVLNNAGGTAPGTGKVLVSADTLGTANWNNAPTLSCTQRNNSQNSTKTTSVSCSSGETLTGGGGTCSSGSLVMNNQQVGTPNSWQTTCTISTTVTASAMCCKLSW